MNGKDSEQSFESREDKRGREILQTAVTTHQFNHATARAPNLRICISPKCQPTQPDCRGKMSDAGILPHKCAACRQTFRELCQWQVQSELQPLDWHDRGPRLHALLLRLTADH